MKNSNKLLTALALVLILVPVLGIAIMSGLYYENNDLAVQPGEIDNFGAIPKSLSAITVNNSFESVNIIDKNKQHLVLKLIKADQSGVKFPNNLKGLVTAAVDENGELQISVKKSDQLSDYYIRIYIYGPHIKTLKVVGGSGMDLQATMDSLELNLLHTGMAHFNPDSKIGKLKVQTEDVQEISFRETGTKSVFLNLKDTNVKSDMSSFDQLSIQAAGTSEIELHGGYGDQAGRTIKQLTLNTLGKAKVKMISMQIDQCAGSFSDSTTVEMPAVNINQMYR